MPSMLVPFLVAAGASLVLGVGGAFAALREPGLALKPLWAVLAFVGVGGAALVPHAPEQLYWFLGAAIPTVSFSAAAGSWEPEVVRALFPLGALVAWGRIYLHRNRQRSGHRA
ncbi:hypothetical protein [Qipengyuania citrea]|uniref:hypothetical protein n=1 Tax=Qipengyuania citrea TaxID=225971 RepID=UPI001A57D05B|nr:hypothetical protein [Qipengyuania citrea]MBL4718425.1 hypothetical protein [Erythrobacter sp.]MCP2016324.1 hypothetical protein [Qipengyuania citrea]